MRTNVQTSFNILKVRCDMSMRFAMQLYLRRCTARNGQAGSLQSRSNSKIVFMTVPRPLLTLRNRKRACRP